MARSKKEKDTTDVNLQKLKRKLIKVERSGKLDADYIDKLAQKYADKDVDVRQLTATVKTESKNLKIRLMKLADHIVQQYYRDHSLKKVALAISTYQDKYELDNDDIVQLWDNIAKKTSSLDYSAKEKRAGQAGVTKTAYGLGFKRPWNLTALENSATLAAIRDPANNKKLDGIVSMWEDAKPIYTAAGILSALYRPFSGTFLGAPFPPNANFMDSIHPWYVIVYGHKIPIIENRTVHANIPRMIENVIKNDMEFDNLEENVFFQDLMNEPDDFEGTGFGEVDPIDDLRRKAEIQKDNCFFSTSVRMGKLYGQDFGKRYVKLGKGRTNAYQELEINVDQHESNFVREWLAGASLRTVIGIVSPIDENPNFRQFGASEIFDNTLLNRKNGINYNPFRSTVTQKRLMAVPTISVYPLPPNADGTPNEPINFEDTLARTVSVIEDGKTFYKSFEVITANNLLIFIVNRRSYGDMYDDSDLINDYDVHNLAHITEGALTTSYIDNFSVDVKETIHVGRTGRKVYNLAGVICSKVLSSTESSQVDQLNLNNDWQTGCGGYRNVYGQSQNNGGQVIVNITGLLRHKDADTTNYYCYDSLAPIFSLPNPNGRGWIANKPITQIKRDLTEAERAEGKTIGFIPTASEYGTVFVYAQSIQ